MMTRGVKTLQPTPLFRPETRTLLFGRGQWADLSTVHANIGNADIRRCARAAQFTIFILYLGLRAIKDVES